MVETGIGVIVAMVVLGVYSIIKDLSSKMNKEEKYKICIKKSISDSGLPLIRLMLNGKAEWFLLDTGANSNYLQTSVYDSMENRPDPIGYATTNSATTEVTAEVVMLSLGYKDLLFVNEPFSVMEVGTLNSDFKGRKVIGIIGSPFFEKHEWSFDFEELVVRVNAN